MGDQEKELAQLEAQLRYHDQLFLSGALPPSPPASLCHPYFSPLRYEKFRRSTAEQGSARAVAQKRS